MPKPKTVGAEHERRARLRKGLGALQRSLMRQVEFHILDVMGVSESRYFGIVGYPPHVESRQAAVLLLRRHPKLRLQKEWVALYLNMSIAQVEEFDERAALVLAAGSTSAFGAELELICTRLDKLDPVLLLTTPA